MKLFLIILLVFSSTSYAEDFVIDEYSFSWSLIREYNLFMTVHKQEDAQYISLQNRSPGFRLSGEECVLVSKKLNMIDYYFDMFKKKEGTDVVKVSNDTNITYSGGKHGFKVVISVGMTDVSMNRKSAIKVRELLSKGKELLDFVDKKININ